MNQMVAESIRSRLVEKLADSLAGPIPLATTRHIHGTVSLPNKATAVIGMRRAGKTTFLHQLRRERLDAGVARERLPYINFEDVLIFGAGEPRCSCRQSCSHLWKWSWAFSTAAIREVSNFRSMFRVAESTRYGTYCCREVSNWSHVLRKTSSDLNFRFIFAHCCLHDAILESITSSSRQHFSHNTRL